MDEQTKKFKTGDVVKLKSGGEPMTIARYLDPAISKYPDIIECMFFNSNKDFISVNVREEMLDLVINP
jgi:uncharacterized protein YodC (DUF2158 family)